jgi:hypothetical protein
MSFKFKLIPSHLPALFFWATEAATVFLNGCIAGIGGGSVAGVGTGAVAATASGTITPGSLTTAAMTAGFAAGGNGLKRLVVWHDANPIPNPFAPPGAKPPAE